MSPHVTIILHTTTVVRLSITLHTKRKNTKFFFWRVEIKDRTMHN